MRGGPEESERRWLAETFRPDEPQLTWRALAAGVVIGALLCLSNLYVALKTGWSLGVTVTASVMAWGLFAAARSAGLVRRELGVLENNAACSVASSAAYMTGGGNLAALPAILMLTGARMPPVEMALWFALIAALGVLAAIPLKRRFINVEALPFPTGTATAQTIRALHAGGDVGSRQVRLLVGASLLAGAITFLRDSRARWLPVHLPAIIAPPLTLGGHPVARYTLGVDPSLLLVGAGALTSARTGWSLLLGALLQFGVIAPVLVSRGEIATVGYRELVWWSVWPAAGILVSAALTSLALDWRVLARSLRTLRPARGDEDPLAPVECPHWWALAGFALLGPLVGYLMVRLFGLPWWSGLVALPLSLVMAAVAARATGETDVTPTQALGPVTQLACGALAPNAAVAGLAGANVTAGIGLHAADLLTDLKAGFLLGARPRAQLVAQLVGVLTGAAIVAPAFHLLVADAAVLGSHAVPAPSAMVWAGVARAMEGGMETLPASARYAGLAGALLGVLLTACQRALPRRVTSFVPSATGLGVALILPASSSAALFLGALGAWLWRRWRPAAAHSSVAPIASGLIAGESLVGIGVALAAALATGTP